MGKIKWAGDWGNLAEEGLDRNIKDIVVELNNRGYSTIGESCEGGKGHLYSVGYIGLGGRKLTPKARREIKNIISTLTPIPFRLIKQDNVYSIAFEAPLGDTTGRWDSKDYKEAYEGSGDWSLAPDKWESEA